MKALARGNELSGASHVLLHSATLDAPIQSEQLFSSSKVIEQTTNRLLRNCFGY